jgi:hypothetical protein
MGDAPLADMLLSKVGSMEAAPKRIGCPGLVGVQASNWVKKFVLSGGRSNLSAILKFGFVGGAATPPGLPATRGAAAPRVAGNQGGGSFPSVWAEAEEISGNSML